MVQAMEGAIDGTSDGSRNSQRRYGSGNCRRSDGWFKRWKEQWMVQAMDHEAVKGDMDQEAVEGAMDGTSDGTRSSERDMDQEAVEGAMDGSSDRRSDGWYKRWNTKQSKEIWIRKLSKEGWMVQVREEAIDGTSDGSRSSQRRYGSGSCRRSDGWCKGAIDGTSDGSGSCRV